MNQTNYYYRSVSTDFKDNLSFRAGENKEMVVDFYASVFNQKSTIIRERGKVFREVIHPNAFDEVVQRYKDNGNDVYACVNHNPREIFARLKNQTLSLNIDETGLKASVSLPDTQQYRDFYTQLQRGDFYECSFVYSCREEDVDWSEPDETGLRTRTVMKVNYLRDVSIITHYGAFGNTDVHLRMAELLSTIDDNTLSQEERNIAVIEADVIKRQNELENEKTELDNKRAIKEKWDRLPKLDLLKMKLKQTLLK